MTMSLVKTPKEILAAAFAIHDKQGFVSKTDALTNKKKGLCSNALLLSHHFQDEDHSDLVIGNEEHDKADALRDFTQNLMLKTISGDASAFETCVLKFFDSEHIDVLTSDLSLPASLPEMFYNHKNQKEWDQREAELKDSSEFVGDIGKVLPVELNIEFRRVIKNSSRFVNSSLLCCTDNNQNVVKFFIDEHLINTNPIDIGSKISVLGQVKDHRTSKYSGVKETLLKRVQYKVISDD